jgi:hypothetical protein
MDFAAVDNDTPEEVTQQSSFLGLAVLLSVLVHLLLVYFFMQSKIVAIAEIAPDFVAIRLLPSNPNRLLTPSPDAGVLPVDTVAEPPLDQIDFGDDANVSLELNAVNVAKALETEAPLDLELAAQGQSKAVQEPEINVPRRPVSGPMPTLDSISQSVRELVQSRVRQFYSYACNRLEAEEGLKACAPKSTISYAVLDSNTMYQAFSPATAVSRSERASAVVSSRLGSLASRLREEAPDGLSGYLIEELQAGISHSVNEGNRAVRHMIDMTDKSDAAAQARAVLGNPLLLDLKRAQQNPTRGVLLAPP